MSNRVGYPDTINRKGSKQGPFLMKMVPETIQTSYDGGSSGGGESDEVSQKTKDAVKKGVKKVAGAIGGALGIGKYVEKSKSKTKKSGPDKKQLKKVVRRLNKADRKTERYIKKLERKGARVDKKEKRLMEKSAKFEDKAQKKADKAKALRRKKSNKIPRPSTGELKTTIKDNTRKKSSKPKMNYNIDTSGKPKVKTASNKKKASKAPLAKREYDRYKKTTTVETDNPSVRKGATNIYNAVKGLLKPNPDKKKKRQEARAKKKYGDKGAEILAKQEKLKGAKLKQKQKKKAEKETKKLDRQEKRIIRKNNRQKAREIKKEGRNIRKKKKANNEGRGQSSKSFGA